MRWNRSAAVLLAGGLPLVASLALWAESFAHHDRLIWKSGAGTRGLVNCDGRLQLRTIDSAMPTGFQRLKGHWDGDERGAWEDDHYILKRVGPSFCNYQSGDRLYEGSRWTGMPPRTFSFSYHALSVSHGFLTLVSALPIAWLGARSLRRRMERDRPGFPVVVKGS